MRLCWMLVVMVLALRPVWAQPVDVAGQDDPAFQAALDSWLAEDEAAALEGLAGLAQGGNRAAQVLLALIDKTPSLQGPYLSGLGRDERVALLRVPGGISGTSWMRAAAADVPLAGLWVRLWDVAAAPGIVTEFARADEDRAARVAVLALRARQRPGLTDVAADPDFPASMRFAVWEATLAAGGLDAASAQALADAAALAPGDPQREMAGLADDARARDRWFETSPVAVPVAAMCARLCPETPDTCAAAAMTGLGGYRGLVVAGSPVEMLVDSVRFAESDKGRSDLMRRVLLRRSVSGYDRLLSQAAELDACFGAGLAAEVERFR